MRDNWVRVRFGLYKDDLAKVVDVDNASQRASILLLPRLDLNAMANRVRGGGGGGRVLPRVPPCIPPRRIRKGLSSGPGLIDACRDHGRGCTSTPRTHSHAYGKRLTKTDRTRLVRRSSPLLCVCRTRQRRRNRPPPTSPLAGRGRGEEVPVRAAGCRAPPGQAFQRGGGAAAGAVRHADGGA